MDALITLPSQNPVCWTSSWKQLSQENSDLQVSGSCVFQLILNHSGRFSVTTREAERGQKKQMQPTMKTALLHKAETLRVEQQIEERKSLISSHTSV